MTANRNGQVVTFYSYKGGTGRTMALANVAWILAANGKRVLAVDWDLESPGLFRFFSPFMNKNALASTGGVIELIRSYEWARNPASRPDGREPELYAKVKNYCFSLDWTRFPPNATLDFLSAGQQMLNFAPAPAAMNWDDLFENRGGGEFFDALRTDMKRQYDYTLIDSRTGLSDIGDVCTMQLPDILVDCFTLSDQGIDGAAKLAQRVSRYSKRTIQILPVPMRVDLAEKIKADTGRLVAMQRFETFPAGISDAERQAYWTAIQVPYQPFYAYEETLATFADQPGSTGTLLSAYELLTRHITNGEIRSLPTMDESVRAQVNAKFLRRLITVDDEIMLLYAPQDQVWAEWIESVLTQVGMEVHHPFGADNPEPDATPVNARTLTIVSNANVQLESSYKASESGIARPPLAVYISDVPKLKSVSPTNSAHIAGLSAAEAVGHILAMVGRTTADTEAILANGPRFAGEENQIFNVPVRNRTFTGREAGLRELRKELRARSAVVLSGTQPVALQGMGGIGKTQLAIEYAHRFHTAYDVVWWMSAESVGDIEASLVDLGGQLGLGIEATGPEGARSVLAALGRIKSRWLLILDNAEDPEAVGQYLPKGSGHVLITSRNPSWGERAQPIPVEVFLRSESVEHLRQRIPEIRPEAAGQIAALLEDLPIAIAAAGAWLADTNTDIDQYLEFIHQEGPSAVLEAASDPIQRTWDLSLKRLRERSPAAYRLFQLCCVLAPEIARDLVFSDKLAELLRPIDPKVSDRIFRGSLVQQINRLALLRVDPRGEGGQRATGQILIHRVVQDVVRSRMSAEELATAKREVQGVLAAARPDGEVDDPERWPAFRMLWPHLDVSDALNSQDESVRELFIDRVRYQWLQGDLAAGQERAERTAKAWEQMLSEITAPDERKPLQIQLLRLRFNLANIMRDLGLFKVSLEIDEQVLAAQQELLGSEHPHTLMTVGSLAGDLRGLGRYPEALERDSTTYSLWFENFGEDHPRTLAALNNLAVCDRLMGNFQSARERDEVVHQRRRVILSETNLFTLASAACVARDVRDAGDYERSAELLRSVLRSSEESRGPQSRAALTAKNNLAISLRSSGHVEQAAQFHDDAYEALNELLGPTNPETLSCRLSLALSHLALGTIEDADRAKRELTGVAAVYRANLGDQHPHTMVCVSNLAMAERVHARKKEPDSTAGYPLAAEAFETLNVVLGNKHPYTLSTRMNLAICIAERGQLQEAHDIFRDTADAMDVALGPEHPNTLRCRGNLALVLGHMGHPGAGEAIAKIEERLIKRLSSESHPIVQGLRKRHYLYRIIDPHPF